VLECDYRLGVFCHGDDGGRLRGGSDHFQFRIVEVEGDAADFLDDELGVGHGRVQDVPVFRPGAGFIGFDSV
jgi:hypothetical protein